MCQSRTDFIKQVWEPLSGQGLSFLASQKLLVMAIDRSKHRLRRHALDHHQDRLLADLPV